MCMLDDIKINPEDTHLEPLVMPPSPRGFGVPGAAQP